MNKHITLKNGIVVSPILGEKERFRIISLPKSYQFLHPSEIENSISILLSEQTHENHSPFSFRSEPLLSFPEKELARLLEKPKFRVLRSQRIKLYNMHCDFTRTLVSVSSGSCTLDVGESNCNPTDTFSFEIGFSIALSRALEKLAKNCRSKQ